MWCDRSGTVVHMQIMVGSSSWKRSSGLDARIRLASDLVEIAWHILWGQNFLRLLNCCLNLLHNLIMCQDSASLHRAGERRGHSIKACAGWWRETSIVGINLVLLLLVYLLVVQLKLLGRRFVDVGGRWEISSGFAPDENLPMYGGRDFHPLSYSGEGCQPDLIFSVHKPLIDSLDSRLVQLTLSKDS